MRYRPITLLLLLPLSACASDAASVAGPPAASVAAIPWLPQPFGWPGLAEPGLAGPDGGWYSVLFAVDSLGRVAWSVHRRDGVPFALARDGWIEVLSGGELLLAVPVRPREPAVVVLSCQAAPEAYLAAAGALAAASRRPLRPGHTARSRLVAAARAFNRAWWGWQYCREARS